jgi:predicted Fe-S protein YdhL (DUF1289 family)
MPLFPKIQSPCPYKSGLAAIMDGEVCRMCKRQVFDLTAMTDGERVAFLAGCEEEVCVSYSLPMAVKTAAVAAALALPGAAAASDEMMIIVGGITDPGRVEMVKHDEEAGPPALPVVYEEEEPEAPAEAEKPAEPRPGG